MFQKALICTDLSDGLNRLKDFIPSLAQSGLKEIIFAHSVPLWEEGSIPRVNHEKIKKAQDFFAPLLAQEKLTEKGEIEVKVEIVSGRPRDTIPKLIKQYQCDLILMGTPIRSLLQEKIFGSTTSALTKSTNIPLMILRPQLISTYTTQELNLRCQNLWQYLLIPYNDTETDKLLINNLKKILTEKPTQSFKKCLLCWVIDEGGGSKDISTYHQKEATEKLAQVKTDLESCGLEVATVIKQGNAFQELLKVGMEYDINAVAIASSYKKNLLELSLPDLAKELLLSSWFPLLFFPIQK